MVTATIREGTKRTFTVDVEDADRAKVGIQAVPQWSATPVGGVTLNPAADGLSCEVSYLSAMPKQILTVTVDADLGRGVQTILREVLIITAANVVKPPFRGGFVMKVGPETSA